VVIVSPVLHIAVAAATLPVMLSLLLYPMTDLIVHTSANVDCNSNQLMVLSVGLHFFFAVIAPVLYEAQIFNVGED